MPWLADPTAAEDPAADMLESQDIANSTLAILQHGALHILQVAGWRAVKRLFVSS